MTWQNIEIVQFEKHKRVMSPKFGRCNLKVKQNEIGSFGYTYVSVDGKSHSGWLPKAKSFEEAQQMALERGGICAN